MKAFGGGGWGWSNTVINLKDIARFLKNYFPKLLTDA